MKTLIEAHNGIPLGVPREWISGKKIIMADGLPVAQLEIYGARKVEVSIVKGGGIYKATHPNQTAALEWIAKQIKETEDA